MNGRQWQSFVDDLNVHKLVEQYDTDGNVIRVDPNDNQSAPDLLVVEVPQPTDVERSICPSCGVEGTKVAPDEVGAPPGTVVV